jgi:hypothetical protein
MTIEASCLFCKQAFTPKNPKALFCSTKHRVAYFRLKRKVQQDQANGHYKLSFLESVSFCQKQGYPVTYENRYLKNFAVFCVKEAPLQLLNRYISDQATKCYSWRFS